MKTRRALCKFGAFLILLVLAVVCLMPVIFTVINSISSSDEIIQRYGAILSSEHKSMDIQIVPDQMTLQGYAKVFLNTPMYLIKFWNSMFLVGTIVCGQVIISCLSGYGLAKFKFPLHNVIYYLLIVLMMLPYQVTLVSNYIVLDKLGLLDTYASIILPGIFGAFGIFLMKQVFSTLPNDMIEAAKLEGCNQMQVMFQIAIPTCKSGIISLVILSFIDNWNMVEQPLAFLKSQSKYPLSIFLSSINLADISIGFVCGVLAMIPAILLYLFFKDDLIRGMEYSNLK